MTHVDPYLPILVKNYEDSLGTPVPIEEFIKLIEKAEKDYPAQPQDTKHMITRIRKAYYGELKWAFVIPNEHALVCRPIKEKKTIEGVRVIPLKDGYYLDMGHVFAGLDALQYPQLLGIEHKHDVSEEIATKLLSLLEINSDQMEEVLQGFKTFETSIEKSVGSAKWLSDLGDLSRVKLLWSGIVSKHYPGHLSPSTYKELSKHDLTKGISAELLSSLEMSSGQIEEILRDFETFETSIKNNADFATWLGDLGDLSRMKLLKHNGNLQEAIKDTEWAAVGCGDMLGNIDAYVIYNMYLDKVSSKLREPMKISKILNDYYITKEFKDGKKVDRYHTFAECVGLKWDSENKIFSNEDDWIKDFASQLRCAAILCIIHYFKYGGTLQDKIEATSKYIVKEDGVMELKAFLAGLKERM